MSRRRPHRAQKSCDQRQHCKPVMTAKNGMLPRRRVAIGNKKMPARRECRAAGRLLGNRQRNMDLFGMRMICEVASSAPNGDSCRRAHTRAENKAKGAQTRYVQLMTGQENAPVEILCIPSGPFLVFFLPCLGGGGGSYFFFSSFFFSPPPAPSPGAPPCPL